MSSDDISPRLGRYMAKMLGIPAVEIDGLSRISGGASRETYRFAARYYRDGRAHDRRLILRRDPPASLIDTERSSEFRAYKAFHKLGLPVPEPIVLELGTEALDRPFFIMEEVQNCSVASILQTDVDTITDMIALNVTALTRLTYAIAPAFVSRGGGTIINIASVVGIAAEMLNGVYSASKSYVISFGHSLQKDLADKGVRVQTVLPGATATEFWDVAGYAAQKTSAITMSAEDAVDAALVGLDNGELVTIPGLHDGNAWDRWEADRRELSKKFGNAKPALRYDVRSTAAA